jgi:hypothetical protein
MTSSFKKQIIASVLILLTLLVFVFWKIRNERVIETPLTLRHNPSDLPSHSGENLQSSKSNVSSEKSNEKFEIAVGASEAGRSMHKGLTAAPTLKSTKGLFHDSITNLLNSRDLKKVDYARLKVLLPCGAQIGFGNARQEMFTLQLQSDIPIHKLPLRFSRANDQTRRAALDRFVDVCFSIFESNDFPRKLADASFSTAQMDALRKITRDADVTKLSLGDVEAGKAFKQIISEPLFGKLESILYTSLDYSPLQNSYSAEQIAMFNMVVVPILLCRMGDDCGPDGLVTLQICMQHGICGNYVESAIWDSLRISQTDMTALRRFIDRTYLAIQAQDLSMFKR